IGIPSYCWRAEQVRKAFLNVWLYKLARCDNKLKSQEITKQFIEIPSYCWRAEQVRKAFL
ncbi:hypothetical protein, partial [Enterococcus dispar]